jgi:hypothetical protein
MTVFPRNQQAPLQLLKWAMHRELVDEEVGTGVSDERERDGLGGQSEEAAGVRPCQLTPSPSHCSLPFHFIPQVSEPEIISQL